jgi:predicted short-subunit dehydrogenase-like oxidoreductase (DUF2520 family)
VPDREIEAVARSLPGTPLVGHCSAILGADILAGGGREGFTFHPLMTVTHQGATFRGAAAAISGTTPEATATARDLAHKLGMDAIEVSDDNRALYHAAASMASNYLVTVESIAQRLGAAAGVERRHLGVLASAALGNWISMGDAALTGPIARGDLETVHRQREAVAAAHPDLLPLWDALAEATAAVAGKRPL